MTNTSRRDRLTEMTNEGRIEAIRVVEPIRELHDEELGCLSGGLKYLDKATPNLMKFCG